MRAKNCPRTIAEVKRLIFTKIKNRTKTKERARSLAEKRARKVKEISALSKCDIATAYATWISLGRPIRRPVLAEELRSKINSERFNESSSATQSKLSSSSRPLLSQESSLNAQSGRISLSSNLAPRVLDCTRTVVQSIPSPAKTGSQLRDTRPPVVPPRVQDYPHTGTQNITSITPEGGSKLPTCHRVQASAADRARTGASVRSAEEQKKCAAAQPPAPKPDNGESLLDWEWDADEGCFQPRQTLNNRSDGFEAFLYEKGKRKRKTTEVIEMERRFDSFHQSKQTRVSPAEQTKSLVRASHQIKQTRVSPAEPKGLPVRASHKSKQTRVSPAEQTKSQVDATHKSKQTRVSPSEKNILPVGSSFQKIDPPSLHQITQTKVTSSGKISSLLGASLERTLPCNGAKVHKAKESSHSSASFSKFHRKGTIPESSRNACSAQVSQNHASEKESGNLSAMQSQREIGCPWFKHSDMRMVETGKNSYSVSTQFHDAGISDKGPVSLRDDTRILLRLKESLDQIEYGPNYDVAAERRAWQRFALAGRQTVSESQSETEGDVDENIPYNTLQPATQNAAGGIHTSYPNKNKVPTAAGHSNSSQATYYSDGILHDAADKINKRKTDHTSKLVVGANAGSLSNQQDLNISKLEDFSIRQLKGNVICVLRSSKKRRMRLSKIIAGVEELAGVEDSADSDPEDSEKGRVKGVQLILCILSLLEKEGQVVIAKADSDGAALAWKLGPAA